MKLRLTGLSLLLAAVPLLAQAADPSATAPATQRTAMLQALPRGAAFTANSQQYQMLPSVRAVASTPQESPQQALAQVGGGKVIETKGAYVVYTATQQGPAALSVVSGRTSFPTVVNIRTNGIGILPGTIRARLKDPSSAEAVASAHGLQLVRNFPHLQTAFYQAASGQDVVAAAAAVAADPRVVSAEPEVLEHVKVPY